jgi:hypothetical protein
MYLEYEDVIAAEKSATSEVVYYNEASSVELKNFISPAQIESVDASGQILLKLLDDKSSKFLLDPLVSNLHPCGYWNYLCTRQDAVKPLMKCNKAASKYSNFYNNFDWKRFMEARQISSYQYGQLNNGSLASIAPFELFTSEQRSEMPIEQSFNSPVVPCGENYMTCDCAYNPRYIWSSLRKLNSEDISYVYEASGLINNKVNSVSTAGSSVSVTTLPGGGSGEGVAQWASSALVLLPAKIDLRFIQFPNVNFSENLANLNIACVHREYIELFIGLNNFLPINYPHLIQSKSLNLLDNKLKLDLKYMLNIMFTSLDLSNSLVSRG